MAKVVRLSAFFAMFALVLSAGTVSLNQSFQSDSGVALTAVEVYAWFPAAQNPTITTFNGFPAGWTSTIPNSHYAVASGPATANVHFNIAAVSSDSPLPLFAVDLFGFAGANLAEYTRIFVSGTNEISVIDAWDQVHGGVSTSLAGARLILQEDRDAVGYSATPEPATLGLIGSSLLGLGMWRRRRIRP